MKKTKTEQTKPEAFKEGKTGLDASLIDQWLAEHYKGPEDILGQEGLLAQLTKAVVERALSAELTHHLGCGPGRSAGLGGGQLPQRDERQDRDRRRRPGPRSRCRVTATARLSRA